MKNWIKRNSSIVIAIAWFVFILALAFYLT